MVEEERKIQTTIQFGQSQFDNLYSIIIFRAKRESVSKIVRDAVDFYIRENYPQFLK